LDVYNKQWHYGEKDDNYPCDDWASCCVPDRKFHETCAETFRVIDGDWTSCCVHDRKFHETY